MTPEVQKLVDALREQYGDTFQSDDELIAFVVTRWHAGLLGRDLPAGWSFRDELTTTHLKAYFKNIRKLEAAEPIEAGEGRSLWEVREISVVAAWQAGWFETSPAKSAADIGGLRPGTLVAIRNAIEAYYVAQVAVDPT